jgi:hypothetical protein
MIPLRGFDIPHNKCRSISGYMAASKKNSLLCKMEVYLQPKVQALGSTNPGRPCARKAYFDFRSLARGRFISRLYKKSAKEKSKCKQIVLE